MWQALGEALFWPAGEVGLLLRCSGCPWRQWLRLLQAWDCKEAEDARCHFRCSSWVARVDWPVAHLPLWAVVEGRRLILEWKIELARVDECHR